MTRQPLRAAVALVLIALSAIATPASSHNDSAPTVDRKSPRPGPNFPTLESYYPAEAKRAGQEGTTVIHICVGITGTLTAPPTVAVSSGNETLDSAALNLANAANGSYIPGTLNGVAQESCTTFRINFQLTMDPLLQMANFRIPTIMARLGALGTDYGQRLVGIEKMLEQPKPEALATANLEAVRAIRQYARDLDVALDEAVGVVADMLNDMESLGQSPDIPENERSVFIMVWPNERSAFTNRFRLALADSRDGVRTLDELADYISFSTPRRPEQESAAKPRVPSPYDHVDRVRQRVLNVIHKARESVDALSKGSASMGTPTH